MSRWGESDDRRDETPVDEHNHALAVLRHLIATIDCHKQALRCIDPEVGAKVSGKTPEKIAAEEENRRYWRIMVSNDPRIWWPMRWGSPFPQILKRPRKLLTGAKIAG